MTNLLGACHSGAINFETLFLAVILAQADRHCTLRFPFEQRRKAHRTLLIPSACLLFLRECPRINHGMSVLRVTMQEPISTLVVSLNTTDRLIGHWCETPRKPVNVKPLLNVP